MKFKNDFLIALLIQFKKYKLKAIRLWQKYIQQLKIYKD